MRLHKYIPIYREPTAASVLRDDIAVQIPRPPGAGSIFSRVDSDYTVEEIFLSREVLSLCEAGIACPEHMVAYLNFTGYLHSIGATALREYKCQVFSCKATINFLFVYVLTFKMLNYLPCAFLSAWLSGKHKWELILGEDLLRIAQPVFGVEPLITQCSWVKEESFLHLLLDILRGNVKVPVSDEDSHAWEL